LSKGVTDIHLIPRKKDYFMQIRQFGSLLPFQQFSMYEGERLVSHLKFMASMDIGERRKPQSGSFSMNVQNTPLSLRVSTLPTAHSKESLVIRILPQEHSIPIQELSLYPNAANKLLSLSKYSHGMIILTGPTNSGKTTTLYSLVQYCSSVLNRNVITLEDPVERQQETLLQVQVNEKAGITYSAGLKAILRHDPDIIMVGEVRDRETAEISIQAALSGHLVLTTMHTRDAKGAIYRLLELGIQWHEIEQTLIAVSAQRLINLTCPFCGTQCKNTCRNDKGRKRAAVYEILTGSALNSVLREANGESVHYRYPHLKELLSKGVALGFVSEQEYEKWIQEES
jgi:competence protein ComGA